MGGGGGDLVGLVSDNGGLSNVVGLDGQLVVDDGVGAGVSGHDGGGRVGGNGLGVDMGLVDNLLDGVDLVGGLDVDGTWNVIGDGVGDVLVDNDGALNGDGDVDGDINVVLVDLSNGDDVGLLGSDPGVGPHGGEGLGDGDGIGRGGSSWDGCGGDGGVSGGGNGQDGGGQGLDGNVVLGSGVLVGGSGLGDDLVMALDVLVAGLDLLVSGVHGLVTDNTELGVGGLYSGSTGVAVMGLTNGDGGGDGAADHAVVDKTGGMTGVTGVANVTHGGSAGHARGKGKGDHKSEIGRASCRERV